ncbi:PPK2 family polyphosphate kinase [Propionibacteriaceae bacterium Y2011]|uniref:PPK2 family polyphosphate kinase n=1 Tax=Microlunatus sp. Y2014 TaxID=3418488 RepID=UPI003B4E9352
MGKKSKSEKDDHEPTPELSELLRLPKGRVDLDSWDPNGHPGYPGKGKKDADEHLAALAPELSDLQERLYANGRSYGAEAPRLLVILQGSDTAGKGGVIRKAIGLVDPQGVELKAFKQPTKEELSHDFLWRIRRALPSPGMIGIFDRSQYEDVLIARVQELVPEDEWRKRYTQINAFEREVVDSGTVVIKCFLHVSNAEQKVRLGERLDNPEKYWKYNPGDVDKRLQWDEYRAAYNDALTRCNTKPAPWYVIPSDRKWYRNWAVAQLILEHLRAMDLSWPEADFDIAAEQERLAET